MTQDLGLTFNTIVDGLIDQIEAEGVRWYVLGGTEIIPSFLAFELSANKGISGDTVMRMDMLRRQFGASIELRKEMIEFALSVGSFFVEVGNRHPIVSEGVTTQ